VESGAKDVQGSSALSRLGSLGGYLSKSTHASAGPECSLNRSLLYVKPHANKREMCDFIRQYLVNKKCKVLNEGSISSANLRESFEVQYSDLSKKAIVLEPHECPLSSESMMEFEKKFKIAWSVAVRKKLVQSSRGSCELLDIPPSTLSEAWMECVSNGKMVKLGRGFYCGLIDTIPNKPPLFCINGFFMAMRAEYLADNASVHYFLVEWDNAAMSWSDFRKNVIGGTNPSFANETSLRSLMNARWEELGLACPLDMMRNGLHASASAFEALVERSIWLGVPLESDIHFGANLFSSTVPASVLKEWTTNPTARNKYIFDHMENKGSQQCLEMAQELHRSSTAGKGGSPALKSMSPQGQSTKLKGRASPEMSTRGNSMAMGQPLAAIVQSPDRARRLPALSPIRRPSNSSLLSRTTMRNTPLGSEGLDRKHQERDEHLSVPQGRYFSPERLHSPPRRRQQQHQQSSFVLSDSSRPSTPQSNGGARGNNSSSPQLNQTATTPGATPSNKIFSI